MSDSPDGVLQRDQAADFFLWLPRYAIEGRSLTCLVDVCRASNSLIGSGTGDLARELAEALGLNGKEIASWSIEPFNTPFYAHDIDADDLLDYMIPAWRLELRIDDWDGPAPEPVVGPISFWGYDETWIRDRAPWDFSAHETIVIALNGPDPDLSFLDAVREGIPVEVVRYEGTVFAISQLRIRMGTVPLPEAEDDVFDIVDACYRQAMIIHQHSAHALFQA